MKDSQFFMKTKFDKREGDPGDNNSFKWRHNQKECWSLLL